MITLGNRPGLICKGTQPVDVYVGRSPVTPGITLDDYPLQEESGSVVTCEPLTGYKLGVTSHITAVQEGTGDPSPDNVRPIVGWDSVSVTRAGKNLLPLNSRKIKVGVPYVQTGRQYVANQDGSLTITTIDATTSSGSVTYFEGVIPLEEGTTYYGNRNGAALQYRLADGRYFRSTASYTARAGDVIVEAWFWFAAGEVINTTFIPTLTTEDDADPVPYTGETHTRALPETVYGGTLDWRTGLLTVTHERLLLSGTEWWRSSQGAANQPKFLYYLHSSINNTGNSNNVKCSHLRSNWNGVWQGIDYTIGLYGQQLRVRYNQADGDAEAWKAYLVAQHEAGTPVEVAYPVTPHTIQLTPQQLVALAGTNTIYSTSGDTTVTYRIRKT